MTNTSIINNNNNKRLFLFAIIGMLAIINIALFVWNRNMDFENEQLRATANDIEQTQTNLQLAYENAKTELNAFKGENNRLDSLLTINKSELEVQQSEIKSLLEKRRLTTVELDKANTLISNLKLRNQTRVNTLDSLFAISQALAETNLTLQEDLKNERTISDQLVEVAKDLENQKDTLSIKVEDLETEKENLAAETEKLIKEKESLQKDNEKLNEKINRAAILVTENVTAHGVRFKNNGKIKNTKDYRRTEKIKICYEIQKNPSAQSGLKELLVRITHPEGFTLAVAETGSGHFTSAQDVDMQYTTTADIDYKSDETQGFCTYWAYDNELSPGIYLVEIFHLGHLIGDTNFELKSTLF